MFCPKAASVLLSDKFGNDMLCSILFLSLGFNVLTDYFYWSASICQQAKSLTPKGFFPEFFPDFRVFLFQQSATGTFISIDKFTKFSPRLRTEHHMHMIYVMIPFFQNYTIPWSNMFPYLFCSFWNWIIYHFSSIFYYHDQMILHQIYRMRIMIYFSHADQSFLQ